MDILISDSALPDVRTAEARDNGDLHNAKNAPLSTPAVQTQEQLDKDETAFDYRDVTNRAIIAEKILNAEDCTNVSHISGSGKHQQYH